MKETFLSEVQRVALGEQGDVNNLAFRDPDNFVAGELHNHLQEWHTILEGYKDCDLILQWMTGGVNVLDFARPFKGVFKGKKYENVLPPKAIFQNHPSCKQFSTFITTSISSSVETGAVKVWGKGRGPRSKEMLQIAKRIFNLVTARNLQMTMHYVPSASNPADWFTRQSHGSDAMLSPEFWSRVQQHFGGETGHTFDLMALDSNAMRDADGSPLPHFTPFPTPGSSGVNVFCQDLSRFDGISENAYVFPPFALIAPLLRFVQEQRAVITIIVPMLSPLQVGGRC
ncbi:hypothetical protein OS493_020842 [Desmophyllum pertusum]|uniref:Uncharacterized protein n=1 Tax=Desmophyllum pertusum TaxID=174260 RepID=A0A9W9YBK2_9CNID|nr:hypothetical protein OS493_020842 [Desmophyllum pertusum]